MSLLDQVKVIPLKQIVDGRGKVMHMLRRDDPHFIEFGEIYFSVVNPGKIKAWHYHKKMTLNYACISGSVKLAVFNEPTRELREFYLTQENYCLIQIPPGFWNGFMNIGNTPAIIANCATIPHDKEEIYREDPDYTFNGLNLEEPIDYVWND